MSPVGTLNEKPLHAQTPNAENKLLRRRRAAEAARIKVHELTASLQEARPLRSFGQGCRESRSRAGGCAREGHRRDGE